MFPSKVHGVQVPEGSLCQSAAAGELRVFMMEHFGVSELVLISMSSISWHSCSLASAHSPSPSRLQSLWWKWFFFLNEGRVFLDTRSVLLPCFSVLIPVCEPVTFDA